MSVESARDPGGLAIPSRVFGDSLAAARRGQTDGAGALLDAYRPYLLAIANRELPEALNGKAGASDLVQETLLKGIKGFHGFQGQTHEELAGWLRQILLNEVANIVGAFGAAKRDLNREQPTDSGLVDSGQPVPIEQILLQERKQRLETAIAGLPEPVRQLIEMRHQQNRSFEEIAAVLGKTEVAVRRAWARAVQLLQQELHRHDSTSV